MAMEQRTLNIINICKGGTKYNNGHDDVLTAIKKYMADECAYNADWYSDKDMYDIMWTAMQDYLDNCDKPSYFMWQLKSLMYAGPSITHAIIVALSLMQVRSNNGYVNGFDDRICKLDKEVSNNEP